MKTRRRKAVSDIKTVIICEAVVRIAVAVCATVAAVLFENDFILCWYLLLPFIRSGGDGARVHIEKKEK